MALITMITMNACNKINNETANDVCDALSEKYGEFFNAIKIGDRFNTDSAKLYVHPTDNENILFVARINKDTGEVEDNYVEEKVNYQVEDIIKDSFAENGIVVSSICMVVTKDPIDAVNGDYTPKSFSEEYGFDHYTIYLVLKSGDYSASDILNSVKSANEATDVKLLIIAYVFSEDGYSECASVIQENPEMSITMIEERSPVSSFSIKVEQGECSISETELAKELGGS